MLFFTFKKCFKKIIIFLINNYFIFLYYFDTLILKIIFKLKNYYFYIFPSKKNFEKQSELNFQIDFKSI